MAKTQTELLAEANNNMANLIHIVETKDKLINDRMEAKEKEVDTNIENSKASNGAVNLYQNSRFMKLNTEGTHPLGFYHYYGYGSPVYSIVTPDFSATEGDRKIVADLVKMVGDSSWYNTPFKGLKVVCKGTKDVKNGRHWSLNQNVFKGRGPLTRGCFFYIKPSSVTNTNISFQVSDNPSGAYSERSNVSNTPLKVMGQGISNGNFLGFNINVFLKEVDSSEEVTFYIVAPFFVEGIVNGYRTSPIDIEKL